MSWKGNVRTLVAIAGRMERAERRRSNEVARHYKAIQKQEDFKNGQRVVQEYNNYINLVSSIHKETSEEINWHEVLSENEPSKPVLLDKKQKTAEFQLSIYKPSFFDKLFGSQKAKIKKLQSAILIAEQADKTQFENSLKQYENDYKEWTLYQKFAKGVLSSDTETYSKVIEYLDPFSDIKELGSGLNITFEKDFAEVSLFANGVEVIPNFIVTQTATGKVSKKKIAIGKFYELYQDYICGCVLRVARETFSLLPLKNVFINVLSEMVNPVNGQLEKQTILSIAIPKSTLVTLNFESLDPSESMKNFVHNMKFSKTTGFSVVSCISPKDVNKK